MKYIIYTFIVFAFLISGCSENNNTENNDKKRVAKGDPVYGGVFRMNEIENFSSLFPLSVTDVYSNHITSQVYQGLLRLDPKTLEPKPCLAKSYEANEEATAFIYHLRDSVFFHDDKCFEGGNGRLMTAQDVKFSLDKICAADPLNKIYWLFKDKVKGAGKYYQSTQLGEPLEGGVPGIKVLNDSTIKIILSKPFAGFNNIMAHYGAAIFPKEAFDMYGRKLRVNGVGTGPFKIKTVKEDDAVVLTRNDNYWEKDEHGNQLPYLDGVKISFIKEKKTELNEFKKGNLDMISKLPVEEIQNIMGSLDEAKKGEEKNFRIQTVNGLSTQYYGFLTTSDIFSDVKVRKAFNYAIDREKLVINVMQGNGTPAIHGFVPKFPGYPIESVEGYKFNIDRARELIEEAGYPNGKGFPKVTLQLNSGGTTNELLAQAIQSMINENLGIDIQLDILPINQHQNKVETGMTNFWRLGWVADYADPEIFLNQFYSIHVPDNKNESAIMNSFRYKNKTFDRVFEKALAEQDPQRRMQLFAQADQIVINDAVIMPIYYDDYDRLVNKNVENLPLNSMNYVSLTRTYFDSE